jgi:DNA ligase-1
MSSPAKKRKTNDYKASSQPVRSLDYFFAKQKDAAKANPLAQQVKAEDEGAPSGDELHASLTEKERVSQEENDDDLYEEPSGANIMSDEELARKLQAQWDQEDQVAYAQANGRSSDTPKVEEEITKVIPKKEEEVPKQAAPNSFFSKAQGKGTLSLQSTAADEDTVTANIPFDESPLSFAPAKYIPELQKHWATDGGHASYALLTRCFVLVNGTTSRIKIVDTLVNLLRCIIQGDPDSLLPAVCESWSLKMVSFANKKRCGWLRTPSPLLTLISSLAWAVLPFLKLLKKCVGWIVLG